MRFFSQESIKRTLPVRMGGDSIIGWRLLGTDPEEIRFNIFRSSGNESPAKLNDNPLAVTTDFIDVSSTARISVGHLSNPSTTSRFRKQSLLSQVGDSSESEHLSPVQSEQSKPKEFNELLNA